MLPPVPSGSVSVVTNSVGGAVTQEFDPWGKLRSGSIGATKRNYTGQYLDDTGLLFYNARYYDPALGRFVSADTIVADLTNPQHLNRYSYVTNNPVNHTDPTGHCIGVLAGIDTMVCIAVGALMVGAIAYVALDAARKLAEQYPVDTCALGGCLPSTAEDAPKKPALPEKSGKPADGGQLASPPNPPLPDGDDPWEQKLYKQEYSDQQKNQVRTLADKWDAGTYSSKAHSIVDHARRHGYGDNYIRYLMDAAGFNTRGATRTILDAATNTIRYNKKNGEFIIYRDGKIVSYGVNR